MTVRKNEWLTIIVTLIYILFNLTPYLTNTQSPMAFTILFILVFTVTVLSAPSWLSTHVPIFFLCVVIWLLQMLMYRLGGISSCSYNKIFSHFMTWIFMYILYLQSRLSIEAKKCIVDGFMLIFFVNLIDNIRLNIIYPNASEGLNFAWGQIYHTMNVGGSVYCTFASLMGVFCFARFRIEEKKCSRVFWLLYFFLCLIYVYVTARAISLITIVIGTIWILVASSMNSMGHKNKILVWIILTTVCVIILFAVLPYGLERMAQEIDNSRLSARLLELSAMLRFNNERITSIDSSGVGRIELYIMSLKTFLSSPRSFFFGIGEHPSVVPLLNSMGIGAHSAIFDVFPEYGVIGAMCLFGILKGGYDHFYVYSGNRDKRANNSIAKILFFLFIVNACLNNIFSEYFLIFAYFIIPLSFLNNNQKVEDTHETL